MFSNHMYTHSCRCILWQFEGCKKHRATWCKGFCRKHFNAHGTKEGDVPLKGKKRKTEKPLKRETEISLCTTVEDLWCLWETAKFFSPPQRVAFITQLNNFAKDRYAFELKRHTRLTEEYASQRAILQQEYFAVAKDCSNQQTPERMAVPCFAFTVTLAFPKTKHPIKPMLPAISDTRQAVMPMPPVFTCTSRPTASLSVAAYGVRRPNSWAR